MSQARIHPDMERNPLLKLPRNMRCPCFSGKKFKHCCLRGMPFVVSRELAAEYEQGLKDPMRIKFVNEPTTPNGMIPPPHSSMHAVDHEKEELESDSRAHA